MGREQCNEKSTGLPYSLVEEVQLEIGQISHTEMPSSVDRKRRFVILNRELVRPSTRRVPPAAPSAPVYQSS